MKQQASVWVVACVSMLHLAIAKSLIDTITKIDGYIMQNKTYDKELLVKKTRDASLLPAYLHVFNGKVGKFRDLDNVHIADNIDEVWESLNKYDRVDKLNAKALVYFLHHQSLLTNEIESPFEEDDIVPTVADLLNDDNAYLREESVVEGKKTNYLAHMNLWETIH